MYSGAAYLEAGNLLRNQSFPLLAVVTYTIGSCVTAVSHLFMLYIVDAHSDEVRRSLKEKHGELGIGSSPAGYRKTSRPRSRRLCHTMALIRGENCLRSQERCRLHEQQDTLAR
ncbi:hypothetical protein Q8A73_001692 [Channa argus]|nr:hypothetical protein Q8A73_001692 [Channa argus]